MKTKTSSSLYHRMLLIRDLSSSSEKTFYLVEDRKNNTALFLKDTTICDNGVISIGTCFALPNPQPITKYMEDDILLITTKNLLICLKSSELPEVDINHSISNNSTTSFCMRKTKIEILSMASAETSYSSLFCDRQRAVDTMAERKGYGCY